MNNQTLINYLAIKEQIAALEKQLKPIRDEIESGGSFENDAFKVDVKQITQNRVVGCEELIDRLGVVKVTELGLIKESAYNKITVKAKAAAYKAA